MRAMEISLTHELVRPASRWVEHHDEQGRLLPDSLSYDFQADDNAQSCNKESAEVSQDRGGLGEEVGGATRDEVD